VTAEIKRISSVTDGGVNVAAGRVTVEGNPSVSDAAVVEAAEEAGSEVAT
jgi:copper chaperone CopZ